MAVEKGHSAGGAMTLLRTKLSMPRPRSRRVERPQLEALLDASLERRLTVVCSPAGFGKTTLVAGWLAKRKAQVCWLSLDEYDGSLARFWSYVAAALDGAAPGVAAEATAMLTSRQPPAIEVVLTALLNSVSAVPGEILLVFDDYHAISEPAVHASVRFFLSHLPPGLHLIVIGREEPPLGLASYRAKAELIEVSTDELRFSRDEVAAFMSDVAGVTLDEKALGSLAAATEGWAAAIQLAALTVEGAVDPGRLISGFSGDNEYLFAYLAEEVFERLDEKLREFLLLTSTLDSFCGGLCDEIAPGAGGRGELEVVGRLNLFLVPLDAERTWYRYHGLFRDFLRTQARHLLGAAKLREVVRGASRWFDSQGIAGEAIRCAIEAGDTDAAADLISKWADLFFKTSDLVALRDWIAALPAVLLAKRPALCFVDAWALLATGRGAEVEPVLAMIEAALGARADGSPESLASPPKIRCALGEILVIRSSLAFVRFDPKEIERRCLDALGYLPERSEDAIFNTAESIRATALFNLSLAYENDGDIDRAAVTFEDALSRSRETQNIHLIPMITAHLGNLRVVQGRLSAAEEIYRGIVENSVERPPSPLSGLAYVGYGSVLLEHNRIDDAVAYLAAGLELGRRWANWEVVFPALVALARADNALGFPDRAAGRIAELGRFARELSLPPQAGSAVELYAALYGRHRAESGALVHARELLARGRELVSPEEPEALLSCRLLLASGAASEAAGRLAALERAARRGGRYGRLIEILVLECVAESEAGLREAAERHLSEALERGAPEGYLRLFLDLGPPMVRLLESTLGHAPYRKRLLAAFAGGAEQPLPAGLSERELEVLRDLAAGFSNQETAERLFISVNTVKTHLKNIFTKLEVSSRAQAIARAHALGLLRADRPA